MYLGRVDMDFFVLSTLPSSPAQSAELTAAQAEYGMSWNILNQCQPNPGHDHLANPVFQLSLLTLQALRPETRPTKDERTRRERERARGGEGSLFRTTV